MNTLVERSANSSKYPIESYKNAILETLMLHKVLIISALTGAGKSTQVPQYLLEAGYQKIIIAVPTRAAACRLATRVSEELGSVLGELVGYQTSYEKCYSDKTKILYITDGTELMKKLHNRESLKNAVLIIDEAHDLSINVETLVAWSKREIANGSNTKVILMSATMDVDEMSKFYDDCPIINVPGKVFPITSQRKIFKDLEKTILEYAVPGNNILVFAPGKSEIYYYIKVFGQLNIDATILPFHADLSPNEQARVFEKTNNVKIIVATNIAETSLTIEGINVVIDLGLERHMENIEGVDTLTVGPISYSSHLQRMGRAGRTSSGTYIYMGQKELEELEKRRASEMLTSDICQIVLKLASIDVKANDVEFLHQPPVKKIESAQKTLRLLGAFDKENNITECGMIMAQLPISVRYARMLVEAYGRDVLSDVVTIAALAEVGGIKKANIKYGEFSKEMRCDLLAEFDIFNLVREKLNAGKSEIESFENINKRNYYRVLEIRSKLADILYNIYGDVSSSGNRSEILKSCAAGLVEFLYVHNSNGWYRNPNDENSRKLNIYSGTLPSKFLLGLPQNISLLHKEDTIHQILYIIRYPIMVDIGILREVAPHLFSQTVRKDFRYDSNEYIIREVTLFGDVEVISNDRKMNDVNDMKEALANWLAQKTITYDFTAKPDVSRQLARVFEENSMCFESFEEAKTFYLECLRGFNKNSIPHLKKTKNFGFLLNKT